MSHTANDIPGRVVFSAGECIVDAKSRLRSLRSFERYGLYEKVIKVKADVAALLTFFVLCGFRHISGENFALGSLRSDDWQLGRPTAPPLLSVFRVFSPPNASSLPCLVDSVFSSYWHAFRNASELSASIIPVRSQKYIDRRFVPLRFSKSCLQPPLLPGFYPHSQGATWGPVHVGVRSQTRPPSQP
jgi:hypothetical protein